MGKHSSSENFFDVKFGMASGPDNNLFINYFNIIFIVLQLNALSSFRKLFIVGTRGSLTSLFEYVSHPTFHHYHHSQLDVHNYHHY